jgi:3',5'-cyclic AMP phosphodiesterase CpdA
MLIAQMSDPHLVPRDVRLFGRLDTAGYLERAVAHLNALAPDAVLITGDLTNDGDAQVYAAFAAIVGRLRAPFFVLTGNHDDRELMRQRFADDGYLPGEGPLCYAIDRFAMRLIALDTAVAGEPWDGSDRNSSPGWMQGFWRCRTGPRWWRCITRRFAPVSAIWTGRCCAMPTRLPR